LFPVDLNAQHGGGNVVGVGEDGGQNAAGKAGPSSAPLVSKPKLFGERAVILARFSEEGRFFPPKTKLGKNRLGRGPGGQGGQGGPTGGRHISPGAGSPLTNFVSIVFFKRSLKRFRKLENGDKNRGGGSTVRADGTGGEGKCGKNKKHVWGRGGGWYFVKKSVIEGCSTDWRYAAGAKFANK